MFEVNAEVYSVKTIEQKRKHSRGLQISPLIISEIHEKAVLLLCVGFWKVLRYVHTKLYLRSSRSICYAGLKKFGGAWEEVKHIVAREVEWIYTGEGRDYRPVIFTGCSGKAIR